MRRIVQWSIILISFLLLSSCIDVFQHIAIKNGNVDLTLEYSLQKMLFESASALSGEEVDYDEMLGESDEFFDALSGLSGQYETIDTELEIGAKVRVIGPIDVLIESMEGDPVFIPYKQDGKYRIVIPALTDEESSDDAENEMAMAFMASSKYTILISLENDLRKITSAQVIDGLVSKEVEGMVSIKKYGSSLLIEIPMMILFANPENIVIELL